MTPIAGKRGRLNDYTVAAPSLRAALTSPLPTPPASFDWAAKVTGGFPMFDNGTVGDCWIASVLHKLQLAFALVDEPFTLPSDAEVDDVYFGLTGGQDTGLADSQVISAWAGPGLFGTKARAASIDIRDTELLRAASYAFGGLCLTGELPANVPETQFEADKWWTLEPGQHPQADGHAFCGSGASQSAGMPLETWGGETGCSWPWWHFYAGSAYAILPDVFTKVGHGPLANVDLAQFDADFEALRG
jgi:hypothetical protein